MAARVPTRSRLPERGCTWLSAEAFSSSILSWSVAGSTNSEVGTRLVTCEILVMAEDELISSGEPMTLWIWSWKCEARLFNSSILPKEPAIVGKLVLIDFFAVEIPAGLVLGQVLDSIGFHVIGAIEV